MGFLKIAVLSAVALVAILVGISLLMFLGEPA